MPEPGDLILYETNAPATQAEFATNLFYAWEQRGRGWWVWPYPVDLEPPFRALTPTFREPGPPGPTDDGRKPTLLTRLSGKDRGRTKASTEALAKFVIEEPAAEEHADFSELVSLPVALPPEAKISAELAAQRYEANRIVASQSLGDILAKSSTGTRPSASFLEALQRWFDRRLPLIRGLAALDLAALPLQGGNDRAMPLVVT